MLVDAHVHIWRARPEYLGPSPTLISPTQDVPLELLNEYMTEHEVERAVLVQPIYPGEDNSYVADCAAQHPQRFAAVCVVDPNHPHCPERLAYWVRERGCRGLRLRPRLPDEVAVFGSSAMYPLWEQARSLNIVINVLMGLEHVPALAVLVERFPEVAVVIDHLAHPDITMGVNSAAFQALLALAQSERVFVKLSGYYYFSRQAYPYMDCSDFVRAVYDRFGPTRLIWGSDFPHVLLKMGYGRALHFLQRVFSFLRPDDLGLIMGGNAARLYWP